MNSSLVSLIALLSAAWLANACDFGAGTFDIVPASGNGDGNGDGDGDLGGAGDGDGDTGGTDGTGGDDGTGGNDGTGGGPMWDCNPFGTTMPYDLWLAADLTAVMLDWLGGPYLIPDGSDGAIALGVFKSATNSSDVVFRLVRISDQMSSPVGTPFETIWTDPIQVQEIEQVLRTPNDLIIVARASSSVRQYSIPILGGGMGFGSVTMTDFFVSCADMGQPGGVRAARGAEGTNPVQYAATCQSDNGTPGDDSDDTVSLWVQEGGTFQQVAAYSQNSDRLIKHYSYVDGSHFMLVGDDTDATWIRNGDLSTSGMPKPVIIDPMKNTSVGAYPVPMEGLFFTGAALTPGTIVPADAYAGTVAFADLASLNPPALVDELVQYGSFPSLFDASRNTDGKPVSEQMYVVGPAISPPNSVWLSVHQKTGELLVRKPIISNTGSSFSFASVSPLGALASVIAYRENNDSRILPITCGVAAQ